MPPTQHLRRGLWPDEEYTREHTEDPIVSTDIMVGNPPHSCVLDATADIYSRRTGVGSLVRDNEMAIPVAL